MTLQEFYETLEKTGLPVAHAEFQNDENGNPPEVPCPYIIYNTPAADYIRADGKVVLTLQDILVVLYQEHKSLDIETQLETILNTVPGGFWNKEEYPLSSEELYLTSYELQLTY